MIGPDDPTTRFRELAKELAPIEADVTNRKVEMITLAHEINQEILTEAYPGARVLHVNTFSEVKPSDYGNHAKAAIATLEEHKIEPSLIIVDHNRKLVLLCKDHGKFYEPTLPSTAKPNRRKGKK